MMSGDSTFIYINIVDAKKKVTWVMYSLSVWLPERHLSPRSNAYNRYTKVHDYLRRRDRWFPDGAVFYQGHRVSLFFCSELHAVSSINQLLYIHIQNVL